MISVYLEMVKDAMFPRKRGVITKRNKYIRIEELQHFTADEIRALRLRLHLSVEKTVEAWEGGYNEPSGPALRLMNMLRRYPDILTDTHTVFEVGGR